MEYVHDLVDFIRRSPSAYHAVACASEMLDAAGFTALAEKDRWEIVPGGRYYVTRNRSSLVAFTVPENGFAPFQIIASHSDSPAFKLKPTFEDTTVPGYVRVNVDKYGGLIYSTWLDKPLSIAGRVLVKKGNRIETRLVDLNRNTVLIPNMPIHFNREVNNGYAFNPQVDLLPLYGGEDSKGGLLREIADNAGCKPEDIISHDLILYNRTPGSVWGAGDQYFSCPRIDDLECVYTSLVALLNAKASRHISVCVLFDNEEVGSHSKQGAGSTLLLDVFKRVSAALGADDSSSRAAIASSFMVSADNAHAVHPNHSEKYDKQNRTFMNAGIVIKHNPNQKYTTDAVSDAIFTAICERAGVAVQHFSNRSDMTGGSTLGSIANTHASMNTIDIGLAQLAMHSSYETAGCADVGSMIRALTAFYETTIEVTADGEYELI